MYRFFQRSILHYFVWRLLYSFERKKLDIDVIVRAGDFYSFIM